MYQTSQNNIKLSPGEISRLELALTAIKAWAGDKLIEVCLFGSFAKGRQHQFSSLDLLVIVSDSTLRFVDRKVELERLLNQSDEMPQIDALVYTEDEILELIEKMESFVISVIDEAFVVWNDFNEFDFENLKHSNVVPSRYKSSLPKLDKIYD
jgi:predicted nucleotidyltransferase